jgi:hypothetical protein
MTKVYLASPGVLGHRAEIEEETNLRNKHYKELIQLRSTCGL